MDTRSIYTVSVLNPDERYHGEDSRGAIQQKLMSFILDFQTDNTFIYRCAMCSSPRCAILTLGTETRSGRMCSSSGTTAILTLPISLPTTKNLPAGSTVSQRTSFHWYFPIDADIAHTLTELALVRSRFEAMHTENRLPLAARHYPP